jgi:hypothetical protein
LFESKNWKTPLLPSCMTTFSTKLWWQVIWTYFISFERNQPMTKK